MANQEIDVKIGLWGGQGAGKTTFMWSLPTAALFDQMSTLRVDGADMESVDFLTRGTTELLQHRFPPSTVSREAFTFLVTGEVLPNGIRSLQNIGALGDGFANSLRGIMGRQISFQLRFWDYPGEDFLQMTAANVDLLDYLANCDALIYLFDPVREKDSTKSPNLLYLYGPLQHLRLHLAKQHKLQKNCLPQHLAVCLSKFDHASALQTLLDHNALRFNPTGNPSVAEAQRVFESLADRYTTELLKRYFLSGHVQYFLSSAIGFLKDAQGTIVATDYTNYYEEMDGTAHIRGDISPINILEPLLWAYTRVAAQRRR